MPRKAGGNQASILAKRRRADKAEKKRQKRLERVKPKFSVGKIDMRSEKPARSNAVQSAFGLLDKTSTIQSAKSQNQIDDSPNAGDHKQKHGNNANLGIPLLSPSFISGIQRSPYRFF